MGRTSSGILRALSTSIGGRGPRASTEEQRRSSGTSSLASYLGSQGRVVDLRLSVEQELILRTMQKLAASTATERIGPVDQRPAARWSELVASGALEFVAS